MTKSPVDALHVNGVSAWLDDLSRDRILSGNLSALKMESGIRGVTTNPSIFAAALTSATYDEQLTLLARAGASASEAVFELTTTDVTMACEIFDDVFQDSVGVDGRVSIEVSPLLAHDSLATIAEARVLRGAVNRPNVLVKIPATLAGLEAITAVVAEGMSVNVTLIFSLQRYEAVIDAYLAGLEQAHARGHDLSEIHSVASFFVSRVDTEVDRRLQSISTPDAMSLISQAGLANARLAYDMSRRKFATERARALVEKGANVQRLLWASTGVKDPTLPDTMYVSELVAPGCVNTMPEKTLQAFLDHGSLAGNTISPNVDTSRLYFERLSLAGVDFNDVTERLEAEGISKFVSSWTELLADVEVVLDELR